MTPQHEPAITEPACEPEWIALNHLFSYCAKARRTPMQAGGERTPGEESAGCARKRCLFGAPQG
ncbi:hypothetical protein [Ralstonia sp. RL]|uniref:hypothetical protein n=1 Tax=Ralstonia sp. RL TaxID=1839756 RepID=UPI00257BDB0A|nr:hypothetical protein [Ralstonia sp. RL]